MASWFTRIVDAVFNRHPATEFSPTRSRINYGYQDAKKDLTSGDRAELQRLARFHEAGNAVVNRMADLWECYVVGSQGLQIFPASSSEEWNARALAQWNAAKPFLNIATRDGFDCDQSRVARRWFVDGEVFIILTRESNFSRYQIVEAHRCKSPGNAPESIVDGKEYDSNGRVVAYYFEVGDKIQRIDASFVVHVMEPERLNQGRGIPLISCVLNDLRDLDDLQVLEMRACKNLARIAVVNTTATGEMTAQGARRAKMSVGGVTASNATSTQERESFYRETLGGETVVLQNGDKMEGFMGGRPSVASRDYWRYLTEKVCAGVGIPYVLVFPDSMQGTVYRGALDMANAFFRSRSNSLASHFQRVYEWVIGNDPTLISGRPTDWRATAVRPPRAVNVDVGRNAAAALSVLAGGGDTYQDFYSQDGKDWRKQWRQKAIEAAYKKELAAEFGIAPEEIASSALPAPETQPQTDPEQLMP